MKICMVVFTDLPYDFRVYREVCTLQKAGHGVTVVSTRWRDEPLPSAWRDIDVRLIDIDRTQSLRILYPRFWQQATKLACQERADVYHAHDLDALWPACRAARRHDAALVYDSHELFCDQSSLVRRPAIAFAWRLIERRLIRQAVRVITVAPSIAMQLQQTYDLDQVPVVLRNVPPYRKPVTSGYLRQQLGIPTSSPLALYQGGFLTNNGLAEQITAMQHVDEAGHLALLGNGPTEQELKDLTSRLGLQDRVHFLPRVPFQALHEATCSADIGLCIIKPAGRSFAWSMPNKLFEYMMAGLPVVGGDTPEIRRVIEETDAGIVVDPLKPEAMGAAINQLLNDPERRDELAAASLFAARQNCWEVESQGLVELYAQL
jgi:glycosyltransferase involved in cell wall biosynthesis